MTRGIPPATSASAAARLGIRRAQDKLLRAAETLSTPGGAATLELSTQGRALAQDLPSSLVDLMSARHEMAANVAVLRTEDEVSRDLLELTRRKE
jgi:hypothetical protein